jgi:hypothetical protein
MPLSGSFQVETMSRGRSFTLGNIPETAAGIISVGIRAEGRLCLPDLGPSLRIDKLIDLGSDFLCRQRCHVEAGDCEPFLLLASETAATAAMSRVLPLVDPAEPFWMLDIPLAQSETCIAGFVPAESAAYYQG